MNSMSISTGMSSSGAGSSGNNKGNYERVAGYEQHLEDVDINNNNAQSVAGTTQRSIEMTERSQFNSSHSSDTAERQSSSENADDSTRLRKNRRRRRGRDGKNGSGSGGSGNDSQVGRHKLLRKDGSQSVYGITESHQYEGDESEVWKHHQLQRY
jgi:hypothetical protein